MVAQAGSLSDQIPVKPLDKKLDNVCVFRLDIPANFSDIVYKPGSGISRRHVWGHGLCLTPAIHRQKTTS